MSVAFTAGTNGGGTISNYQFSTDNGSTWTTRSPSATTSPIVITGLTNGVTYAVRIRAVNEVGSGTQSDSSTGQPTGSSGSIFAYSGGSGGTGRPAVGQYLIYYISDGDGGAYDRNALVTALTGDNVSGTITTAFISDSPIENISSGTGWSATLTGFTP